MFSAKAFSGLRNPFSSDFWLRLQEMASIVAELSAMQPELGSMLKEKKRVRQNLWFPAMVGPSPVPTGRAAWTYEITEVNVGLYETAAAVESPRPAGDFTSALVPRNKSIGYAINVAESANTDSVAYGYNIMPGGPPWFLSDAGFTACQILAIPYGTIVFAREVLTANAKVRYEFWAPNPIQPACEEA